MEIGKRLVDQGHDVTVYCRTHVFKERHTSFMGMKTVFLPCIQKKTLETFSHTFLSVLHSLIKNYDIHMVFNAANAPFILPLRLLGKKILINPDGLEWKRGKWGRTAKAYYKFAERFSCMICNRLITDAKAIQNYYLENYSTDSISIPYGADIQYSENKELLQQWDLTPNGYFLQITRFEKENNPLETVRSFLRLNTDKKLMLVGGSPYATEYSRQIENEAGDRVVLPGFIYDQPVLRELLCNAFAYVHGNEVGGTNPALLQAMAAGCCVIAKDVVFNREVLTDCGLFYSRDLTLEQAMRWALENEHLLAPKREAARQRIQDHYNWDDVTTAYAATFKAVASGEHPWRPRWPSRRPCNTSVEPDHSSRT